MKLIILNKSQKDLVDIGSIVGIENHSPTGTFRYNLDKREHIESILGDVSDKIVDSSEITMWDESI